MTDKLVVIINSLKVPKIKKVLLYEMKFLVPNYGSLQNPWLGRLRPQIPVLSVLCPQLNLLKPPPEQNSRLRHCVASQTGFLCPLSPWQGVQSSASERRHFHPDAPVHKLLMMFEGGKRPDRCSTGVFGTVSRFLKCETVVGPRLLWDQRKCLRYAGD